MPPATLITTLQPERTQHSATLADGQSIEQQYVADPDAISPTGPLPYLTLRNGIHYEMAWLTWCNEALAILGTMGDRIV